MADEKGGVNVFAAMYNLPKYAWTKILSGAYGSGTLTRVLSETKSSDEFFRKIAPAVLSSSEGLQALSRESEKDPRFAEALKDMLKPQKVAREVMDEIQPVQESMLGP